MMKKNDDDDDDYSSRRLSTKIINASNEIQKSINRKSSANYLIVDAKTAEKIKDISEEIYNKKIRRNRDNIINNIINEDII